jgi:hypothetical protein
MKINRLLSILCITTQALLIKAENVTFKVLAVNGTPILNIGGKQYSMKLKEYPLYSVDVNIDTFPVKYNYIIKLNKEKTESDSKETESENKEKRESDKEETLSEQFTRERKQDDEPLNEFFNRTITVKKHPELPRAFEAFPYFKQSKLYDDTFIATIVVKCDEEKLQGLYEDTKTKDKIPAEVIYASPYTVKTFKEAQLALSGQSTRHVPKLSYKIKSLKNGKKELYNRTSLKLRAEHMDFSYIRDKLYGDIMNSLGVPAAQNTYTRLFINGRDIGLFDLSDDITNGRYLRETFNNGEKYTNNQENPIYKSDCNEDGGIYGDLGYYGDNVKEEMYNIYSYKGDDKLQSEEVHISKDLIPLLKEIDDYKKGVRKDISLDKDSFLKSMAMEFLAGAIDNYWNKPGNYYLYKDNSKNTWYFHDADFHFSFGINTDKVLMLNTSLSEYPPKVSERIGRERAPLDAFRSHPENEKQFKGIIERLLKTSFNTKAIFPRIDSIAELIREDAQWDVSISPKENPNPTEDNDYLAESIENFDKETKNEDGDGAFGCYSLKYYIKTKASLVAKELNVQIPNDFEDDLGMVETPDANTDDSSSSIKSISWNISLTLLFILLINLLFY